MAGALETVFTGPADFLAGTTGALAERALVAETALLAATGLAFLVLVAFNSCLLIETLGAVGEGSGNRPAPPGGLWFGARVYRQV